MSTISTLTNDSTVIFIVTDQPWYTNWGIYRVMWKGKKPRIIAYVTLFIESYLPRLDSIEDDTLLHVTCRPRGTRLDIYAEDEVIMILEGCRLKNKWIPHLVAHDPGYDMGVRIYVELECERIIECFDEPTTSESS